MVNETNVLVDVDTETDAFAFAFAADIGDEMGCRTDVNAETLSSVPISNKPTAAYTAAHPTLLTNDTIVCVRNETREEPNKERLRGHGNGG